MTKYSKTSITLIVIVSVIIAGFATYLNLNEDSISGSAVSYGTVAQRASAPSMNYLDSSGNDFEKGNYDCYELFSDLTPVSSVDGKTNVICIKTGTKDSAGTDANVKFFRDSTGKLCLLLEDNESKKPGWYVSYVHRCILGTKSYCLKWAPRVDIDKWLELGSKDIVCWSV